MLSSMTGYGRTVKSDGLRTITVEMKSVNNRYLDIDFSMPKHLGYLEEQFKMLIMGRLKRGKVNISVTIDGDSVTGTKVVIDWNVLEQYQVHMNTIVQKYKLGESWDAAQILQLPGVLQTPETIQNAATDESLIFLAMEQALDQLVKMRMTEGQHLYDDLCERVRGVSRTVEEIRQFVPHVLEQYQIRLTKKINDFLNGRFELDEARLMNEVAIYADKSDISEELMRLDSHILQFFDIIKENDSKGRKLDFLLQEMNREINTVGSKSNDATISHYVVTIKSELEKIREQIQNIE